MVGKEDLKHLGEIRLLVYNYEEGLTISSQTLTLMTERPEWTSEIIFPQQCENEGQKSRNSLGSTPCISPDSIQSSICCRYIKICYFMIAEANLNVSDKEMPMVLPRNLVQLMLQVLTVFPELIDNCVEGTTR